MATLLLMVIYISFIGLGIPDSLFGSAWPAIYREFALPISYANFVSFTVSFCTFISSLLSPRVLNRFGTKWVTALSTAMTALALFGFSLSNSFFFIVLLAIPLGLGAGAIDTGLNSFVSLHYKAIHMNFLHCFFGVGVSLSPYLMSLALGGDAGWRGGYRTMALIQLAIAAIAFASLPLWRHVRRDPGGTGEPKGKTLALREAHRVRGLPAVWLTFLSSCAIEYTCGGWGATFLCEYKGLSVDMSAKMVTLFFVGMTLGRFLAGLLSLRLSSRTLVILGESVICAAILVLLLPLSPIVSGIGLLIAGLGVAPIYPNLMHLAPRFFGAEISQSVIGTQMAAASLGAISGPIAFGLIAGHVSVGLFPVFLAAAFAVMLVPTVWLMRNMEIKEI